MGMINLNAVTGNEQYAVFIEELNAIEGVVAFPSEEPISIELNDDSEYNVYVQVSGYDEVHYELPGTSVINMSNLINEIIGS